jgi:hypothetical protein
MLDSDLARLFGVSKKRLNEQVKRNKDRFPNDFMFVLTAQEKAKVVANTPHLSRIRFSPSLPNAFKEHGTIMAANVLNLRQAIDVSLYVVRTFVKMRRFLLDHKELAQKLTDLERKVDTHDESIRLLLNAIRQLMTPPPQPSRGKIGFARENEK